MRTLDITRWLRPDLVLPGRIEIRTSRGKVVGKVPCTFHALISATGTNIGISPGGYPADACVKVKHTDRYEMWYVLDDGTEVARNDVGLVIRRPGAKKSRIWISAPIPPNWPVATTLYR